MKRSILVTLCALGVASSSAWGQRVTDRRTAEIRGGGGDGKCTIEVVVDDVAEVEIRGSQANIRTLTGGPSTFRRFECNQAMPNIPYEFRFKGIDGRGRQDLVRGPEQGGGAVIRIEDSKGGQEGYTFDIFWRGGTGGTGGAFPGNGNGNGGGFGGGNGAYRPGRPGYGNGNNGGNWNGWGSGNGWGDYGAFNYQGRGNGNFQDRNGYRSRLNDVNVAISQNGLATINFQTDRGMMSLTGQIERRNNRSVYARINDGNIRGLVEIEMNGRDRVRRINLTNNGRNGSLNWSN